MLRNLLTSNVKLKLMYLRKRDMNILTVLLSMRAAQFGGSYIVYKFKLNYLYIYINKAKLSP
jgi:hypothetical protein